MLSNAAEFQDARGGRLPSSDLIKLPPLIEQPRIEGDKPPRPVLFRSPAFRYEAKTR